MEPSTHAREVEFAGCTLTRDELVVDREHLHVRFDVRGPGVKVRFPKAHVAVFRGDGMEKLTSLGGHGGTSADGSCYFEWRLLREGVDRIRICYGEAGRLLAEESVSLTWPGSSVTF